MAGVVFRILRRARSAVHDAAARVALYSRGLRGRAEVPESVADSNGADRRRRRGPDDAQQEREWWGWGQVRAELTVRTLTLRRISQDEIATLGRIEDEENSVWCVTLELPWRDNQHDASCVPAGSYLCRRAMHHQKYEVFRLQNVPGREAIDLHIGNSVHDTLGCPLLGTDYGPDHTVSHSRVAFENFMGRLKGVEEFTLRIVEDFA